LVLEFSEVLEGF